MKKERSRFGITLEVLKVVQNEPNFQRYFDFLLSEGFIAKRNASYKLTASGIDMLNELERIESEIS